MRLISWALQSGSEQGILRSCQTQLSGLTSLPCFWAAGEESENQTDQSLHQKYVQGM
jgi:hypothetical protein